jgi:hypothetical protein
LLCPPLTAPAQPHEINQTNEFNFLGWAKPVFKKVLQPRGQGFERFALNSDFGGVWMA